MDFYTILDQCVDLVVWLSEVCRLAGPRRSCWHQLGVVQAHANPPDAAQAEAILAQVGEAEVPEGEYTRI